MAETKASRLAALAQVVTVPAFHTLGRDDALPHLDGSQRYMVRSSASQEDATDASFAGLFTTLGPLRADAVPVALKRLFSDPAVEQAIVQVFVEAEASGVAFCLSAQKVLVEYAAEFEGVTSGRVSPFAALLPAGISRYQRLQEALGRIHARFGACDVEFVGLEEPQFVQVRPITRETVFDEDLVRLKMGLQELHSPCWVENDVCRMLAERGMQGRAIADTYLEAVRAVYAKYLKRDISIPARPFIRVSDQYFMDCQFEKQLVPGFAGLMRLGFALSRIMAETGAADLARLDARELMEKSILMSFAYALFDRKEAMALREQIREALEQRLPAGALDVDFEYSGLLASRIEFDRDSKTWTAIGQRDAAGITVVEGDLESGPFFVLSDPDQAIPDDVVVVTDQLYPQLGHQLDRIRGIICRFGALSSHVAILAREHAVPLRIQADTRKYPG